MKTAFTCLSIFLCLGLQAQNLKIVKENIACAYGIKNEKGEWVVEPVYTLIESTNAGFYLVTADSDKGLLDDKGKIILPPKYDEIKLLGKSNWMLDGRNTVTIPSPENYNKQLLLVKENDLVGVTDVKGKLIIPAQYYYIERDLDSNLILIKQFQGKYYSSYTSLSGKNYFSDVEGWLGAFNEKKFAFIGDYASFHQARGHVGLIDKNGKLIHPRTIDEVQMCGDRIAIKVQQKIGAIDFSGNPIIPPTFSMPGVTGLPCIYGDHIYKISDGKKFGLLNGKGEVIAEVIYDDIRKNIEDNSSDIGWKIFKDKKTGALNQKGKVVIPPIYDTLVPVSNTRQYRKTENEYHYLIVKTENKFGLIDEKGRQIIAPAFERTFIKMIGKKTYLLMTKNLDVKCFDLSNPGVSEDLTLLNTYEDFCFFKKENEIVIFLLDKTRKHILKSENQVSYKVYGELIYVTYQSNIYLFNKQGQRILPFFTQLRETSGTFLEGYTRFHHAALIDKNTGKQITDTIYSAFQQGYSSSKIWANLTAVKNYYTECGNWIMLDKTGNRINSEIFDYPFISDEITIAQKNNLHGIIDGANAKWKVQPIYKKIYPAQKGLYYVITNKGKEGIINENGKFLADTIYDYIEVLYTNSAGNSNDTTASTWWMLERNDEKILINQSGNRLTEEKAVLQKRKELSVIHKEIPNYCTTCFKIYTTDEAHTQFRSSELSTQAFNTIYSIYKSHLPCRFVSGFFPCHNYKEDCYDINIQYQFEVTHLNNFSFSFKTWYHQPKSGTFEMDETDYYLKWANHIMRNGKLDSIKIADIFGGGNLLEVELVKSIQKRDDLKLDCSTPSNLAKMVGNNFSLSQKGVIVYLYPHLGYYNRHLIQPVAELLIPWENLKEHEASSWIAKMFLQ